MARLRPRQPCCSSSVWVQPFGKPKTYPMLSRKEREQAQSPKLISWVLLTPVLPQTGHHTCKHNEALTMTLAACRDTLAPAWHPPVTAGLRRHISGTPVTFQIHSLTPHIFFILLPSLHCTYSKPKPKTPGPKRNEINTKHLTSAGSWCFLTQNGPKSTTPPNLWLTQCAQSAGIHSYGEGFKTTEA